MKTLLAAAACLLLAASANAADIDGDTLALIGADNMTVVSDAEGVEIRGKNRRRVRGPVIYQRESLKVVEFAAFSTKESYKSEAKAVSFSYLNAEKVTVIRGFGI